MIRTSPTAISPAAAGERHELIDALRGFALAGVLLMNLGEFALTDFLGADERAALPTAQFDRWANLAQNLLVDDKAITLFSLLFGVGFAVQFERAQARGVSGVRVYVRRILVLFAIGAAHAYLLWWGDVLHIYALLALILIPLRRLPDWCLLLMAFSVALVVPALIAPGAEAAQVRQASRVLVEADTLAAFSSPSYVTAMQQNAAYLDWRRAGIWSLFAFVFGRFALGYWAGRKRLLHEPGRHFGMLRGLFVAGAGIGTVTALLAITQHQDLGYQLDEVATFERWLPRTVTTSSSLALGIAYASGFALLYLRPAWRARLSVLAPVGRMALTNYLLQTLVCVPLFYGFGLGIGPRFGQASVLLTFVLLFPAQIVASHWWLARFHFGPVEWLWRSLTYGRVQPMRKRHTTADAMS